MGGGGGGIESDSRASGSRSAFPSRWRVNLLFESLLVFHMHILPRLVQFS